MDSEFDYGYAVLKDLVCRLLLDILYSNCTQRHIAALLTQIIMQ